jgi:hypothetical protein
MSQCPENARAVYIASASVSTESALLGGRCATEKKKFAST